MVQSVDRTQAYKRRGPFANLKAPFPPPLKQLASLIEVALFKLLRQFDLGSRNNSTSLPGFFKLRLRV